MTAIGEQATAAGRAIEYDSFRLIDEEAGPHDYTEAQWPLVRRLIHASADFDFNGLTAFHPDAIEAGLAAARKGGTPIIADVEMIRAGLSVPRLDHFGMSARCFISDPDVIERAWAEDGTRATHAMRKAHRQGGLDGAIVGIGNAPTALLETLRLIREENARPALVIGMPVGFVSAAESKARLMEIETVPWISIRGRKGGSTLVVAAVHALLALAGARRGGEAGHGRDGR
ncbi:MAG: precorrin-8X methylmutase [Candidatus Accumulibacter sp.]|jgi:precorrin-8X/cobalt-precorrin-8 methylmutase|nr:precorrin-8X methylmutase [Accumulibacter sp.]